MVGIEGVGTGTAMRRRTSAPLLVVIPAFNEQENLAQLFADLEGRSELRAEALRIVIVDDGSSDLTPTLIEAYTGDLPVELLRFDENQGPGAAFRAGFERVLELAPEDAFVVTLEADGTGDLAALPRMLAAAADGADVVLADMEDGERGGAPAFPAVLPPATSCGRHSALTPRRFRRSSVSTGCRCFAPPSSATATT